MSHKKWLLVGSMTVFLCLWQNAAFADHGRHEGGDEDHATVTDMLMGTRSTSMVKAGTTMTIAATTAITTANYTSGIASTRIICRQVWRNGMNCRQDYSANWLCEGLCRRGYSEKCIPAQSRLSSTYRPRLRDISILLSGGTLRW